MTTATFLVRFWCEKTADDECWRGLIEHVQSGESAAFRDIETMSAALTIAETGVLVLSTLHTVNAAQTIAVVDSLKESGHLGCLKMLHFHQGSQIPNIAAIREGATEAVRMYCDLVKEGAPMGVLDIGGGMAVDYDGSHTNFHSSCNY